MNSLLPGDQLWDRFRVERITTSLPACAWLSPLHPAKTEAGAEASSLLVPLGGGHRFALAELLAAAGTLLALQPAAAPPPASGKTRRLPRRDRRKGETAHRNLPLLGQVEWVGAPSRDGLAIMAEPDGVDLSAFIDVHGPLSAPQALYVMANLVDALRQLNQEWSFGASAQRETLCRALARLLRPDALVLRRKDSGLALRPVVPETESELRPPPWSSFLAPELFREGVGAGPEAWVFAAARIAVFCMSEKENSAQHAETEWSALAEWSSGKRNPVKDLLDDSRMAEIPNEFRKLLARCLDRKPSRRPSLGVKLPALLKLLASQPWAQAERRCEACGFVFDAPRAGSDPPSACPLCGTLSAAAAESGLGRGNIPRPEGTLSEKGGATEVQPKEMPATVALEQLPAGMALIHAGPFLSGERKTPRTLRAFAIDQTPVTEGDYKLFLAATTRPARPGGPGTRAEAFDRHPVVGATWFEASEFAEFYGKRLPTVHEWEKAARGADGRKFPFGGVFKSGCGRLRVNAEGGATGKAKDERGTAPVGSYQRGASPYGILDMAGNVLEWTSSARRAGERIFRAVKGACFMDGSTELARCTSVQYFSPERGEAFIGFRCVKDVD